jgi:hypothetical protein
MRLQCHQFGIDLRVIDGFFVAGRFNDPNIVPISKYLIDQIPMRVRRPEPCEKIDGGDYLGIDIYYGHAIVDRDHFFIASSMTAGKFMCSLSRENMYRHLNIEAFPERVPPKRHRHV